MKIYNLGSLNIDYVYSVEHFVRPGETLSASSLNRFPGGKGLNQSVALANAGATVIHGGLIGTEGDFLVAELKAHGVDVSPIETVDCPTGHAIIQVDREGQNSILLFAGANHRFDSRYIRKVLDGAEPGDVLVLQNEINALEEIISLARAKGMMIAFNPSPYREDILRLPLADIDLWLCNEIEGKELTGKEEPDAIIAELSARYPGSSVLLTLGKDGALLRYGGKDYYQPIFPCKAVDTTAAGDTFTGFFIAMLTVGKDPAYALKTAAAASSVAVSRNGAAVSIPRLDEVLERMRQESK